LDETRQVEYACWGEEIEHEAHQQMRNACRLPVSVAAALMPDAHVGYGLPIGGVLATENSVIPYAVGVDIACRVMLSVFDLPASEARRDEQRYASIIEDCTLFGVGKGFRGGDRAQNAVMDEDWSVSPVTLANRDKAWEQLGTSGSGNHFVEFGEFEAGPNERGVPEGRFLAVVSHSGSRGTGAAVCDHYSKLSMSLHPDLPKELKHLAWLPLAGEGSAAGQEYWAAMELMGMYASANHHVIHSKIVGAVGAPVRIQVENHHNFAWKETHAGKEVIVHRKGATPAGAGVLGYIPGTMVAPGYLVEGRGEPCSLDSASHGAGRKMSRTKAKQTERWDRLREFLKDQGVSLLSAGLDESPIAYKNIDRVMAAQSDLVRTLGKFTPRIVKMAPDGERAED
jgi:tRNA-splicing ligase RtcB